MTITKKQKEEISLAYKEYLKEQGTEDKSFSQNKFAKIAGVNASYLGNIAKGYFFMSTGKNPSVISDNIFEKVAEKIGYSFSMPLWRHFKTDNFERIITTFEDAREGDLMAIDGNTGYGKSYAVSKYYMENRKGTYVITASDDLTVKGFVEELAIALGVKLGSRVQMRKGIVNKLKDIKDVRPLIIIDEAENLKDTTWKAVKTFIDALKNDNADSLRTYYCGIVILGMDIKDKIANNASKNKGIYPQINRRFAGSWRRLFGFDAKKEVSERLASFEIRDVAVVNHLQKTVKNYGELMRIVSRSLKHTKRKGELVTMDVIKAIYED